MRLGLSLAEELNRRSRVVVCLCTGSNQRDIERALQAGAESLDEIGESCGAGLDCESCHPTLRDILHRWACERCPNRDRLDSPLSDPTAALEGRSERGSP